MERVICLLIGYVFGLFQTAYFYGMHFYIEPSENRENLLFSDGFCH